MLKRFLVIIIIIVEITAYIYKYSLILKPKIREDITKLLELDNILKKQNEINENYLRIYKYPDALCYKYNTYSQMGDYKYKNLYMIKDNNNTYSLRYKIDINDIIREEYNYLILIKIIDKRVDIMIKYKENRIYDKIILEMILGELYKK